MSRQTVENAQLIRPSLLLFLCAAGVVLAASRPCEAALQLELELVGTNNQFQPDNISLDVNSAPGQTDLGDDNYLRNSYGTAWGSVSYGAMRLYAESQVFAVPDSASFGTRQSEAFATVTGWASMRCATPVAT